MKFVFRISGGHEILDPAEDSDTVGSSSNTVRMEYLFVFRFDIVNFA